MISLLMPPNNPRDVAIKAHPFRFVSTVTTRPPEEVEIPLSECLKKAVTLMVDSWDGQMWLAEVSKVTPFIANYLNLEPVADYAAAHARSLEMGRPLLDKLAMDEAVRALQKKHAQGECDACGKAVAISDLTNHDATVTPPAQVCPDCHDEKGCPFDETLAKSAPAAAPQKPAEDRSWNLFSICPGKKPLETTNLTACEALNFQEIRILEGATWTAVFRTEKRFMILADDEGEPYESADFSNAVDARVALTPETLSTNA